MTDHPSVAHNRLVPEIVKMIFSETTKAGNDYTDALILLESVICGVLLVAVKPGGDEIVFNTIRKGVMKRLAEIRPKLEQMRKAREDKGND